MILDIWRKKNPFLMTTIGDLNAKSKNWYSQDKTNLVPSASFRYKGKAKKKALKHFKHVIKIFLNRREDENNQKTRTGEENCFGRYSRGLRNENGEHLTNPCESSILENTSHIPYMVVN